MGDLIGWGTIVGFFTPVFVKRIRSEHWSTDVTVIVVFLVCLVGAAGTAYVQGDIGKVTDWRNALIGVVVAAIGSYKLAWQENKDVVRVADPPTVMPAGSAPSEVRPPV